MLPFLGGYFQIKETDCLFTSRTIDDQKILRIFPDKAFTQ